MAATDYLVKKSDETPIELICIDPQDFKKWLKKQTKDVQNWVAAHDFKAQGGSSLNLPSKDGSIASVAVGISQDNALWDYAGLPAKLPKATYKIKNRLKSEEASIAALGWSLGTYSFDWYKESTKEFPSLILPKSADPKIYAALAEGIFLTRDLINLPASDMGPADLAQAALDLSEEFSATCTVIRDQELLDQNFPAVYAVGKGASDDRRPCLIDLSWGNPKAKKITLVGKGVCFDTGGLDIKPAQFMKLMKKDMGGAAHVLGIAKAIMLAKLDINLRILIPTVENSVSDKAMRPMDVVDSRKGLTIEIGHTDAEGRVILADALTLACEDNPEMVIDFATLTGAARVALGTEVPALFSNNDALANAILSAGVEQGDQLWRLPLWAPYKKLIEGKTADISNEAAAPYGGAITAGLFLEHFVEKSIPWAHIDVMAWNTSSKPGRPEGGEAMGLRCVFNMIKNHINS